MAQDIDEGTEADDMGTTSQISREHILNRLMEKEGVKFHTQIEQPHGMSTFDAVDTWIKDEFGQELADFLDDWREAFRTNMVPFKRQRAKEMIEGLKAEAEKAQAKSMERLMGNLQK